MWNGYQVVDADAHMHEPQDMWEKYVEPKYLAQAPKVAYMNGTFMVYEADGKIISKDETQVKGPPKESFKIMEEKYGEAFHTWWARRLGSRTWTGMAGTFRCFAYRQQR